MLLFLLNEPVIEEAKTETSEDQEVNLTTLDILEEQLGVTKDKETGDKKDTSKSKSEEITNTTSQDNLLVTEEMTKAFPSLKGLEGKPITAVAEQYQSMNKDYQGTKRELAEMKKQIELLSKTQSSKEEKPIEEEEEIPDPLLDQKGFLAYLKKQSLTKDQIAEVVKDALKQREVDQADIKVKADEKQIKIVDAVVSNLPEGMDPLKAMNTFFRGNPDLMDGNKVKKEVWEFYAKNIKLFASTIGDYIKGSLSKEEINKRAKGEAYKHMKDNLTTAQEKIKTKTEHLKLRTEEKLTGQDKLVSDIIISGYNDEDWNMPKQQGQ